MSHKISVVNKKMKNCIAVEIDIRQISSLKNHFDISIDYFMVYLIMESFSTILKKKKKNKRNLYRDKRNNNI